jgi:L-ascorbate metabolism protein UlaG (beta-lactamase superfamily)
MFYKNNTIELLGHDSVKIQTQELFVYFDPYQLSNKTMLPKVDVIFISHPHQDHCSIEDIKAITTRNTLIITVPDALSKLTSMQAKDVKLMRPSDKISFDVGNTTVKVTAVPAYNVNKFRVADIPFHPKENEWLGFLVEIAGVVFYFSGDVDVMPEMSTFGKIDVAFLPVSGTYVMTAEEASEAAKLLKPQVAIPMHYGSIVGDQNDAEKFKSLLEGSGIKVEILKTLEEKDSSL